MKKTKLLKTLLIPTLGFWIICTVTILTTSCGRQETSPYVVISAQTDSILTLNNEGENSPNLQYSVDGSHWTTYSEKINIPANGKIFLKGNNQNGWSLSYYDKYSHFNITGNVSLSGSIMGLLDNGTRSISSIPNDYCFYKLFYDSVGITSVSEDFLPSVNLKEGCYGSMFYDCTHLTTAPALPATTLAAGCYSGMFYGCTSLTTIPYLPATTLAGCSYDSMFAFCVSLTNVSKLPAMNLADNCYHDMFAGCSSLKYAPELPATDLATYCYCGMFQGCTSLIQAPVLPAMTLASGCYEYMFLLCTSLTQAPKLPATDLKYGCYYDMFERCTAITETPDLPATTLADYCYSFMFQGCNSLTTAPDLPATALSEGCYSSMFYGCALLASVRIGYTGTVADAPISAFKNWMDQVATVGIFYYKGSDTLVNFGFPSGWTINPN